MQCLYPYYASVLEPGCIVLITGYRTLGPVNTNSGLDVFLDVGRVLSSVGAGELVTPFEGITGFQ